MRCLTLRQATPPVVQADAAGQTQLHRAARRGDVQALQRGLWLGGIDQRDMWGRTALYVAADTPQGAACVETLLRAGASPQVPGPMGLSPALCARLAGRGALADAMVARGGREDIGALSEASWRSLLAHLFEIGGTSPLGRARMTLETGWPEAEHVWLGRWLLKAMPTLPETVPRDLVTRVAQALMRAPQNMTAPATQVLARIAQGEAVVLPAAWRAGHAVTLVWQHGLAALCDRGWQLRLPMPPTCEALTPAPLVAAHMGALQRSSFVQDAAVAQAWRAVYRPARTGAWARRFAQGNPRHQRVNNCSMASAEAALFALLRFELGDADAPALYAQLTTAVRGVVLLQALRRYVAAPEICRDRRLLRRCMRKLRRLGAEPEPELLRLWEAMA